MFQPNLALRSDVSALKADEDVAELEVVVAAFFVVAAKERTFGSKLLLLNFPGPPSYEGGLSMVTCYSELLVGVTRR